MATDTIDHGTLSRLVEAGVVRTAHVVGQPGGWAIMVECGVHERPLATKNTRTVRVWRHFETLASYLKDMGLTQFDVDAANYDQAAPTTAKRPDRAVALKRAHEAAAYDQWFRAEVQKELDDPSPELTDEETHGDMQKFFAKLGKEASR